MLLRSCCLPLTLLPLLLVGLLVAFAAGVLPKPVDDAVSGVWRAGISAVVNTQLPQSASLEELMVSDVTVGAAGPRTTLRATVRVQGADASAQIVAREVLARLAGHLIGPFGLGEQITSVELTILPAEGEVPLLKITVSRANIIAWQAGTLSDSEFQQTWQSA